MTFNLYAVFGVMIYYPAIQFSQAACPYPGTSSTVGAVASVLSPVGCDATPVSLSSGLYTFKVHARKTTYQLTARNAEDANEWVAAIQDVSLQLLPLIIHHPQYFTYTMYIYLIPNIDFPACM